MNLMLQEIEWISKEAFKNSGIGLLVRTEQIL